MDSDVCGFIRVTQVVSIYGFGMMSFFLFLFLIELNFFIIYFFSYS